MTPGPTRQSPRSLKFAPDHRLLKRADFVRVYEKGSKGYGRHVTVFSLHRDDVGEREGAPWRLGITATRKSGSAVERNRQRRRIREFFRLNQECFPHNHDFIVNTKRSLNLASHRELQQDLGRALKRLGVRISSEETD